MPSYDGRVAQLSRKVHLNGGEHGSQPIEKTSSLINIFLEDTYSRESLLLFVLYYRGALTVGFRFGAAANPI